jgi:TM2 domain-containing membrane protein YozV
MHATEETPRSVEPSQAEYRPPAPPPAYYYRDAGRRKSPMLAGLLSLMPGLGQIYVGYYQQGFLNVLIVAALISFLAADMVSSLMPLAGFFLVFYWLFNIVDAARRASFYNEALAGVEAAAIARDFDPPGGQEALVGGIVLVVIGCFALAHTVFDLPLRWLEDWWPAALVIVGAVLIYKAVAGRKRGEGGAE